MIRVTIKIIDAYFDLLLNYLANSRFFLKQSAKHRFPGSEAITQSCSVKKVFLKISQNSKENTFAGLSFLIKLQA